MGTRARGYAGSRWVYLHISTAGPRIREPARPKKSHPWCQSHLANQILSPIHFQHPQHVDAVDMDRARHRGVEEEVGIDRFVVAIEEEAAELSLCVQRRRAGVAAGRVARREEVDGNRVEFGVSVRS